MVLAIERHCAERAESLVGTVGKLAVAGGGAINVIPGAVEFTVDLRSGDDAKRKAAVASVEARMPGDRGASPRPARAGSRSSSCPRPRAIRGCRRYGRAASRRSASRRGTCPPARATMRWNSRRVAPIAMLFVRCGHGGISHNPLETMTAEDADLATRVFLHFLEHFDPDRHCVSGDDDESGCPDLHARLDAQVESDHANAVAFLREMVRVPTDTPPGDNARHAEHTAAMLEAMGYAVERYPVPERDVHAAGLTSLTNLIVRRRFGAGPVIALNTHGDVVPPGEGWTRSPYDGVVEDGRMYGRGVAVSKSDFATYVFALRALENVAKAAAVPLAGTIELHFTYDEEFGGELGPAWLLANGHTRPDLALGAGFSYAIVTAHNGCLQLEVSVHGRAAHAAMPETGVDALAAATRILDALYAQRAVYATRHSRVEGIATPTINVGRIDGGTNTNVVPAKVVLKLDRRMIPEEDPASVEAELRAVIERAAAQSPGIRDRDPPADAGPCARAEARPRTPGVAAPGARAACDRRSDPGHRDAALYRCATVRRGRRPDRAVRRRSAHDPRGEREACRRESRPGGPASRDEGGRFDASRPARVAARVVAMTGTRKSR